MIWQNRYDGIVAYPGMGHEFSIALCVPEQKWVLYHGHPMEQLQTSTKIGLFDTRVEAERTAEVIWKFSSP